MTIKPHPITFIQSNTMALSDFKKIRAKPVQHESILQAECVAWFKRQFPKWELLIIAIPNGGKLMFRTNKQGKRYSPEAMKLKREGMAVGAPDLFIAIPKAVKKLSGTVYYGGLWIEMKYGKGKLSEDQIRMREALCVNYVVEVCRTFEEFKQAVEGYFG